MVFHPLPSAPNRWMTSTARTVLVWLAADILPAYGGMSHWSINLSITLIAISMFLKTCTVPLYRGCEDKAEVWCLHWTDMLPGFEKPLLRCCSGRRGDPLINWWCSRTFFVVDKQTVGCYWTIDVDILRTDWRRVWNIAMETPYGHEVNESCKSPLHLILVSPLKMWRKISFCPSQGVLFAWRVPSSPSRYSVQQVAAATAKRTKAKSILPTGAFICL